MSRQVIHLFPSVSAFGFARRPVQFAPAGGFFFFPMGLLMTTRVWYHSKQSGGNLLLLMAIADFADDEGVAFPAIETLAKKSRMTPRHVRRVLRDLEKSGELESQPNAGPHGVNVYRVLTMDKMSSPVADVPTPLTSKASPPDAGVSQTVIEQSKELPTGKKKENELTLEAVRFVPWFLTLLKETGARELVLTDSIRASWADCYEKMVRLDGRTQKEIAAVCRWARNDGFWRGNFMSPMKLRDKKDGVQYFDFFLNKIANPTTNGYAHQKPSSRALGDNSNLDALAEYEKRLASND